MLKKLSLSITLQMLGTISSFLVIWIITRKYGLDLQGQFAIIKSWIDLMIVIACFGLPQSFIFAINQLNISFEKLKIFSLRYMIVVSFFLIFITFLWFEYAQQVSFLEWTDYIYIGISIGLLTGRGLLRGLLLTQNDGWLFAILSALPAILLFLFILSNFLFYNLILYLPLNYLLSSLFSFLCILYVINNIRNNHNDTLHPRNYWRKIVNNGMSVLIQGLSITLLPLSTFWLMGKFGFNHKQIGEFNIALYIYMMIALPLNMIAPIFFNKWSKLSDKNVLQKDIKKFGLLGLMGVPIVSFLYFSMPYFQTFIFGEEINDGIGASQILLFAALPLYFNNLLSCAIISCGYFNITAYLYSLKTISCLTLMCFLFLINHTLTILNVALVWVLSEYFLFIFLYLFYRFSTKKL